MYTFWDPVGLSNELSCEAESFSCCRLNPHRCFQSELLRLYFPELEPWVVRSVSLPSWSSRFICTGMWDCPLHNLLPHWYDSAALPQVLSARLPVSAPPTGLDECFFFNSLIVGLPYGSIFCEFWLFFVFIFVVFLLLFVSGSKLYLPMPPSWLEVISNFL